MTCPVIARGYRVVHHWRCAYETYFGLDVFRLNRALVRFGLWSRAIRLISSGPLLLRQKDLSSRRAAQCLDVDVAIIDRVLIA